MAIEAVPGTTGIVCPATVIEVILNVPPSISESFANNKPLA